MIKRKWLVCLLFAIYMIPVSYANTCDIKSITPIHEKKHTIFFINGMMNEWVDACAGFTALQKKLRAFDDSINKTNLNFALYHNKKHGTIGDINELRVQAKISSDAMINGWSVYNSVGGKNTNIKFEYYKKLGAYYDFLLSKSYTEKDCLDIIKYDPRSPYYLKMLSDVNLNFELSDNKKYAVCKRVKETTQDILNKMIRYTSTGQNLVVVAHSQGNFFLEAAYATLLYRNYSKLSRIRGVGIATISRFPVSDRYVNISQDSALYLLQKLNASVMQNMVYEPAEANNVACLVEKSNCATSSGGGSNIDALVKETGTIGLRTYSNVAADTFVDMNFMHELVNVYLNDKLKDSSTGEVLNIKISKMIKSSLIEMNKYSTSIEIERKLQTQFGFYWLNKIVDFFGVKTAIAQSNTALFAYINQQYTVRVDGTGFDGNEAVSIDGSSCDKSTIQRGSGYFTQSCTGGIVAGDTNKIRVYDTQYDLDIEVPTAYQTMQLRGPIIAPLAPALSEPISGMIRLSWGAVSGATGYEISRTGQALTTVGAVTSYDDAGRTPGTMYCYRLRTIQNGTMSAYSPESCLTVNTLKCQGQWTTSQYNPGQAENRTLSCPSGQTGNISQTHTCQATGQWGATSETNTCTVAPVASCTGSWSSAKYLVGQVEEKYENTCPAGTQGQVRSWHTCQASGTSAVWGGLAQSDNCTAYLDPPTNLSSSSVIGGIQLTWSPVSGATHYYIYKNGDANNYYSSVTGTSWIDANVVNGQSYSYALKSYSNLNNSSVYSPITSWISKTFEAGNLTIDPPQNVTASRFTDGYGRKSIRLIWSAVPSVDSYYIFRRGYVNPNGNGEFLAAVNGVLNGAVPEFMDYAQLNLISGNSYCYYVRAASGNNQSVNSYPDACSLAP